MLYAGVDTHKNQKYSKVVVTDSTGSKIAEASLLNDLSSFQEFFNQVKRID